MSQGIDNHRKYYLDNILVIRNIPSNDKLYSREWILSRIMSILRTHQVRILDPQRDIWIAPDEDKPDLFHQIVILIDGFSHKRPINDLISKNDDKNGESDNESSSITKLPLLHIDTDDEAEENKDESKAEEEKEPEAEERPPMFTCTACPMQFENDIENESCLACEAPRPPMEELIKKYKAEKMANSDPVEVDEKDNDSTPLHRERLQALKLDLRHIVSHE